MVYRTFKDLKISALGVGTMRYPVIDGKDDQIDVEAAREMIAYAMANGVNYYDTAWGYHSGNSELVTGELLKEYPRDSFYLATKFPGYDVNNMDKVEEIFEKQLKKCRVEYFDFYLVHNVCEENINEYLDEKYGIMEYLLKQKENGRIRHLGFSFHSAYDVTKRYLEKYGQYMEFAQIQLNWLDWEFQKAKDQVDLLREYNLPIWVMEPLRGGKLASLSQEDTKALQALRPDETVPGWAFRFLQAFPDVVVTLSGMSNFEQIRQNIKTFQTEEPVTEEEMNTLFGIAKAMTEKISLPCTACRYCTSHCPQGLDIPMILDAYNEYCFTGGGFLAPMLMGTLPKEKHPAACIGCKSCEAVCPQKIKISGAMSDFSAKLKES